MADELVLLKDIPISLLQTAAGDLAKFFTVAFVDVQEVANGPAIANLLGSGTLVSAGTTRAILTAHHVLQVLPRTGRLCILLEKTPAPHTIDLAGVSFVNIARGSDDSVGPDLAAVVLAPSIAGALGSKRLFYSLDSQRERILGDPPQPNDGPWLLQGWLDERTVVTKDPVRKEVTTAFFNYTGFGGVEFAPSIGGFDYLEYPVPIEAKAVAPRSWGGVAAAACGRSS